ncbi:MAG: 1-(5-phosphoribosyl)-5-[(5-phosphoribosylamino)methylideneamino]imidazole-4-carboxamide isomerase [Steroidobacteraceae bacterium]
MQLIPAIDLRGGKCVRLYQGRYDAETIYADDPAEVLDRYAALGARLVHVVDLDGARDGSQANAVAVARLVARNRAQLQLGGGVRDRATVRHWLETGVARVVVGSAAVTAPDEVETWFAAFGADRIVPAFDVRLDADGVPRLATHGWERQSALSLWDAVERFLPHGLRHVLCTDVARDGALTGPNSALYEEAIRRFPTIEWQASGGVRDAADLAALARIGATGAISGRALLDGRIQPEELSPFLPSA